MVAKPQRRRRECPHLHHLGQDEPDGQGVALADKRVYPLLQGDGRDAVMGKGKCLGPRAKRSKRMNGVDLKAAVAHGDDFGRFALNAVDNAIVADNHLPDVVAVQLSHN